MKFGKKRDDISNDVARQIASMSVEGLVYKLKKDKNQVRMMEVGWHDYSVGRAYGSKFVRAEVGLEVDEPQRGMINTLASVIEKAYRRLDG